METDAQLYLQDELATQVRALRATIRDRGERVIIGYDQLCILCPGPSDEEKVEQLREICLQENWSAEYLPGGLVQLDNSLFRLAQEQDSSSDAWLELNLA